MVLIRSLISGNPDAALKGNNFVAISEGLPNRLFGTSNVLGKQLNWTHGGVPGDRHSIIFGVFKDVGDNSSDRFDFIVPLDLLMEFNTPAKAWDNYGQLTYVKLEPDTDPESFNAGINDFLQKKGVENIKLTSRLYQNGYLYGNYEKRQAGRRAYRLCAVIYLSVARFSHRIDLNVWYFLLAGMSAIVIFWLTVAMQAFKAASSNPIQTIKAE